MAMQFPYSPSAGPILSTIEQLRKSFPSKVTAESLQKLGLAPKNEPHVINVLRFLGVIDHEGKKNPDIATIFHQGDDGFSKGVEKIVRDKYGEVFESFGDEAWNEPIDRLTTFFRTSDESSDTVGRRQAGTFIALAGLAKRRESSEVRPREKSVKKNGQAKRDILPTVGQREVSVRTGTPSDLSSSAVGLTVRIEINLPASNDQTVYDSIFRSIRENLVNAR